MFMPLYPRNAIDPEASVEQRRFNPRAEEVLCSQQHVRRPWPIAFWALSISTNINDIRQIYKDSTLLISYSRGGVVTEASELKEIIYFLYNILAVFAFLDIFVYNYSIFLVF